MAVTKALSIKAISGLMAAGATVGSGFFIKDQFSILEAGSLVERISIRELIDKVGLECGLTEDNDVITDVPRECSIKGNGTIRVKRGGEVEDGITFANNETSKLKVSRSKASGYTRNLKFVVDSGDIELLKGGSASLKIPKLEQFETYDIRKKGNGFYLLRRTEAKREKLKTLGLGKCVLPEVGDSDCSLNGEEIKKVRFDGLTIASKGVSLRISRMGDSEGFPFGYRFTFTFPGNLSIKGRELRANTPYDFRIKDKNDNALALERAWESDEAFIRKAGLECGENNECSVSTGEGEQRLNVRVGDLKKRGITSIDTSAGKIKVEKEQEGYNQGLKFTIEGGDVTLTGGEEGVNIEKLEELETYEITEDGGEYFLTRKSVQSSHIKTSLVLPENCELPEGEQEVNCNLTPENFKAINFEGKSGESFNGETMTLTISRGAKREDYPFGYRFSFRTTSSEAIVSSDNKIKANIPIDFRIKKKTVDKKTTLSLERPWTPKSLGEKAGLYCSYSYEEDCSMAKGKLNVMVGEQKVEAKDAEATSTEGDDAKKGRIYVEKDQVGYNQGLKFTVDISSFSLTNGTGNDISTLEEYETYEIKEEGEKYYLTRKTDRDYGIKSSLGLPQECELPKEEKEIKNCSLSTDQFKNINFKGKDSNASASATVNLKISKVTNTFDFPLGYRFTFSSLEEATITNDTNVIKGNTSTDFRIRRVTGNEKTTLSLERAWDNTGFTEMVGLDCTDSNGTICSVKAGIEGRLNIKKGNEKKENIEDISSNPSEGKIKVEKKDGYNQGLKFSIIEEYVTLTGGSGNGTFDKLEEYEIYEITEEEGKYYLTRKLEAGSRIISSLSLHHECELPTSTTESKSCTISKDDFKNIKFDGKSDANAPEDVTLTISKENSTTEYPFGYKFSFKSNQEATITTTSSNSIKINSTPTEFKIKKKRESGKDSTLSLEKKSN